jgi:hypothetical protein
MLGGKGSIRGASVVRLVESRPGLHSGENDASNWFAGPSREEVRIHRISHLVGVDGSDRAVNSMSENNKTERE